MPTVTESTLAGWTGAPSDAEDARHDNARQAIDQAIRANPAFDDASLSVYAKGSYPNHTNVVQDSDVDVAVEMTNVVYFDFEHEAADMTMQDFGFSPYSGRYSPTRLKDDVEQAMVTKFGRAAVTRGNKAIHVRETSTRLAADVVPCCTKYVFISRLGSAHQGIEIRPDRGAAINNFPAQHLQEGRNKNTNTLRRFKSVVRILKRLENKMVNENVISVVPSFLIESLVWNVPDPTFIFPGTWTARVQGVLGHISQDLEAIEAEQRWLEVNRAKYLFGSHQSWTRDEARQFAHDAWNYLGYS